MRTERSDIHVYRAQFGHHFLRKDVTHCVTRKIGWTFVLMEVYEHEHDLNKGRFAHFTPEPQEWLGSVRLSMPLVGDQFEKIRHDVAVMINWIAEHIETPWSLDYREDGAVGHLDFSFSDSTLGFAFKMLFG